MATIPGLKICLIEFANAAMLPTQDHDGDGITMNNSRMAARQTQSLEHNVVFILGPARV
jgi:hypothetical protein